MTAIASATDLANHTNAAEPPDDAATRVCKFLFTVAQSDKPQVDEARVRALTEWLRTNWKSDLEAEKSDASSASSHCSVL